MAGAALDMSLDDIIKSNKRSGAPNPRSRPRGGSGPGPSRRAPNRRSNRLAPYSAPMPPVEAPDAAWEHDMFAGEVAAYPARATAIETGTKLYISNLDYGVSNDDIKELFSELGDLKRYSIHYDRAGRSKGVAEVVYSRRADALAAVKKYNNVQLDGKPMKIEILTPAAAVPPAANGLRGNQSGATKRIQGSSGATEEPRGRSRSGRRRRGPRRGKAPDQKASAEALDADLDKYHAEGMQVN